LNLFKTILDDQKSLPRDQPHKDLLNLINFILRKFFKALAEEPFLAVEVRCPSLSFPFVFPTIYSKIFNSTDVLPEEPKPMETILLMGTRRESQRRAGWEDGGRHSLPS